MSREAFQTYWREVHAPLVAETAEVMKVRSYVQLHTTDGPIPAALAAMRGAPEAYDGVAEVSFDDLETLMSTRSDPAAKAAQKALLEDERNFIDLTRSAIFLVEDNVVVAADRPGRS